MQRRQFTALVATATLPLGGVAGAAADATAQETDPIRIEDASVSRGATAQETDPLRIEDASVSRGGVTASVGEAALTYDDGTTSLAVSDLTVEADGEVLSIADAWILVEDVSEDAYATLRSGMASAFEERSASPLLDALAAAEIGADAPVTVVAASVAFDGDTVADRIEATGTAGSVVPDGTRDLVGEGLSVEGVAALGTSAWSQLTVERGDASLVAEDVTMERDGTSLVVSSPTGEATVPEGTFAYSDLSLTLSPPATIPEPHVAFASRVREFASEDALTADAIQSAAEESGVTASNTAEAVRQARFELSVDRVSEGGETALTNFTASGTLAELVALLQGQL